jgi:hypothetical protein
LSTKLLSKERSTPIYKEIRERDRICDICGISEKCEPRALRTSHISREWPCPGCAITHLSRIHGQRGGPKTWLWDRLKYFHHHQKRDWDGVEQRCILVGMINSSQRNIPILDPCSAVLNGTLDKRTVSPTQQLFVQQAAGPLQPATIYQDCKRSEKGFIVLP